jgi:TolB-like protein/Tfp pilus assembly protein PilF
MLATDQEMVEPGRRIIMRIGVNLGDVVVDGDDLLGEGVNVAARLEQLCPPGNVLISGSACDQLAGRLADCFEYAGEQQLKNIERPVKVYCLSKEGSPPVFSSNSRQDKPIVAVLAFDNMSLDADQVYFSEGITEDVITELSRFRELTVIARNSTFAFRGQNMDVRQIARMLGANYVVDGSVRRAGDRVRVTAQLVEAASGTHLWAGRYDRAIQDVFAIQEEISQQIVATVAQHVRDDREVVARRRRPEDMRAYDLFLQANRLSDDFSPGSQERSLSLFERAVKIDPTFARAYSGLAYAYLSRSTDAGIGAPREKDENRVKALECAERAVALDPQDAKVHCTLGYMCLTWRDFDRGERHLDLARSMNFNDPVIQIIWAWGQGALGSPEKGLEAAQVALKINPHHPSWYNYYLSHILFQLGRYTEAVKLLEHRTIDTPTRHPRDMAWKAASYGHLGRIAEARTSGALFTEAVRSMWIGDPAAEIRDYVDWVVDVAYLRELKDSDRLRAGLRLAGLPA